MADFTIGDADRLSHAYIVSSASPEEGLRLARHIAAAAVCREKGEVPCLRCRACSKVLSDIHPDVITVSRLPDSKGNPRREISVDQIRQMSADAIVLPNEAERKVYIIRDADCMNIPAQNAALKLLEEPPRGVHFVLCVQNPEKLLETVRSRCAELTAASGDSQEDEESLRLAGEYWKLAARDDALALCAWCAKNEGLDNRGCTAFLECVRRMGADLLCRREEAPGLTGERVLELVKLSERCLAMLRVNVGVKLIFGLLAVDTPSGGGNRG